MLVVPIDVRVFMDVPANTTAESLTIDVRLCAGDRLDAVVSRLVLHQHPRLLPAHLRGQLHDALSAAIDV